MKTELKSSLYPFLCDHIEPPISSAHSFFYVMIYIVLSLLVYAYAAHQLTEEKQPLQKRCLELTETRKSLKKTNQELSLMVASLSDPAADEYAIITELGRIPRGSYKINFKKQNTTAP